MLRVVSAENTAAFEAFLNSQAARGFESNKQIVSTRRLKEGELPGLYSSSALSQALSSRPGAAVYEHERIAFPSYPQEWPAEMLWEAGRLTLQLARIALAENWGLKDATPANILFDGPKPVFVDLLSFEQRNPNDPIWKAEAQFVRCFLLPLLASQRWGIPISEVFATHRDGFEPEEIYRLCGPLERFSPRVLGLVSMPVWLSRRAKPDDTAMYQPRLVSDAEKAKFILESAFGRLGRALDSLKPVAQQKSTWSDYMEEHSYDDPAFSAKERFVQEALAEFKPRRVLDAGANTGHFSALAAKASAAVTAIDLDPVCVGQIWRRACEQKLNVLPLVLNLARPTPAAGWLNAESLSFLDRVHGAFDGVLMLALLHHLLVTERVPLPDIMGLAADLTTDLLVIEYIAPRDRMFRRLTRGRDDLHASQDKAAFEAACAPHFEIVRSLALRGTERTMYCLRRKRT